MFKSILIFSFLSFATFSYAESANINNASGTKHLETSWRNSHLGGIRNLTKIAKTETKGKAKKEKEKKVERLLFIGNSFTYCNNLPAVLSAFFTARKTPIQVIKQHTPGGCSFERHLKTPALTEKLIPSEPWSHWILQDQSFSPVANQEASRENGRKLCDLAQSKGTLPVLFLTWAYSKSGKTNQLDNEMQKILTLTYSRLAVETNSKIAPCGPAWQEANRQNPKIILYANDGQHPAPAGTYLAALVFYATLTGENPMGLPSQAGGIKLPKEQASFLQKIAWQTVQNYSAQKVVEEWKKNEQKEPSVKELRQKIKKGLTLNEVIAICGEPSQRNETDHTYTFEVEGEVTMIAHFESNQLDSAILSGENVGFDNLAK